MANCGVFLSHNVLWSTCLILGSGSYKRKTNQQTKGAPVSNTLRNTTEKHWATASAGPAPVKETTAQVETRSERVDSVEHDT